jgi:hypothetical protein
VRAAIGKAMAAGTTPRLAVPPDQTGDWIGDYLIGSALIEREDLDRPSLDAARTALSRAVAARGDLPNVQVLFALANERAEADAPLVVAALKKAFDAAPARDDYAVYLARAMARAGDFVAARSLLGEVMAHPFLPGGRDMARAAMREIVTAQENTSRGASRMDGPPADRPGTDTPSSAPAPAALRPVYRGVGAGEQRVEGQLQNIICSPTRIEFLVDIGDRVAHFLAAKMDAVEFITYRTDLQGNVACGPRTPSDPVYMTVRPGELDGSVVAIEFLSRR